MSGVDPKIRALLDEEAKAMIRDRDERAASVWTAVARRITPPTPDGADPSDSGPMDSGPAPGTAAGGGGGAAASAGGAAISGGSAVISAGSASLLASVTPWVAVAWTAAAVAVGAGGGWWLRGEQRVAVERETTSAVASSSAPAPAASPNTAQPESGDVRSGVLPTSLEVAGAEDEAEPAGRGESAPSRPSPPVRRAFREPAERTPPVSSVESPEPSGATAPPELESQEPEEPAASSEAIEEAALIVRARTQLRSGAVRSALDALWDHAWRFPRGDLEEERERLFVEALVESGDHHAAAARATAFLRRFPDSMHAESVRRFAAAALEAMRE